MSVFFPNTLYEKQDRKNVPWKWMAVDYFETGMFTMTSDVWSFGVVFWEMLSMGRFPYAGGNANDTIAEIILGYRLPVPDEVSEIQWLVTCYNKVKNMCWQVDPKQRSSFSDLVKTFETHLTSEEHENYKRLEQNIIETKAKIAQRRESKHEISNEELSIETEL